MQTKNKEKNFSSQGRENFFFNNVWGNRIKINPNIYIILNIFRFF